MNRAICQLSNLKEQYMKMSPIHLVEKVKARLFLPLALFLLFLAVGFGGQTNEVCGARCGKPETMCHCMGRERHHATMELQMQMKANDHQLNQLLAVMNKAKGKRKVDAMAAVLNAMVQQREQMQQTMMALHHQMMRHMRMESRAWMESRPWNWRGPETCPMMKCPMGGTNAPAGGPSHP
jgi:hypothetical protein